MFHYYYMKLIYNLEHRLIPQDLANELGKYIELYPTKVIIPMINEYDDIDNARYYAVYPKIDIVRDLSGIPVRKLNTLNTITHKWRCCIYLEHPQYVGNYTSTFRNFLTRISIKDMNDMFSVYRHIAEFLKSYIDHKKDKSDIKGICSYLFEILLTCCDAYHILMKVMYGGNLEIETAFIDQIKYLYQCVTHPWSTDITHEFVLALTSLYNNYDLDKSYLTSDGNGRDPFLSIFVDDIYDNHHREKVESFDRDFNYYKINGVMKCCRFIVKDKFRPVSLCTSIYSESVSGESNNDLIVFGNPNMVSTMRSELGMEQLKQDLLCFSPELIRSYLHKNSEVGVSFAVHEQLKMYLQSELNSDFLVANIRKGSETLMVTILRYESDDYVLFQLYDEPNKIYGLSIKTNPNSNERRLITINTDESLSFELVTSGII